MVPTRYSDLQGKVVLVTGSSKAVGAETARSFAAAGAKVVVNGRDEAAVEKVVASIRAESGECIGIAADATSSDELSATHRTIREHFDEVDVLAACRQAALFLASSASSWVTGQVLDVNGGKVML